jgi:hypothetical protein
MPRNPAPTVEQVLKLFRQLSPEGRDQFLEQCGECCDIDLQSADTLSALYSHLADEERDRFRELSGWESELHTAGDESVRTVLLALADWLLAKRQLEQVKRRRRRAEGKHRLWKKWHEEEGLTYGRIQKRIKAQGGGVVKISTIAKGIARLSGRGPRREP